MTPVAAAIDIQVNPADGLAGLNQALKRARDARQSGGAKSQPIRIVLKAGTYVLTQPWVITNQDSGTSSSPLLIEAERPGAAILVGAPPLGVSERSGGRWIFKPPQGVDKVAARSGGDFYVNNSRAVLAREPDVGSWWFVQPSSSKGQLAVTPEEAAKLRKLIEGDKERAILNLMQSWTSGKHRIAGSEGNAFDLQPAPKWPMLSFGPVQRFYVENLPAALDTPGEWIADDGKITYIPRASEASASNAQGYWPRIPTLLVIKGQDNHDGRVSNISISGLRFAYTSVPISLQGWVDKQAASDIAAVIELENAADVRLTKCEVRHTGGYAIWLKDGVANTEVSRCVMDDLGAGGIKVGIPVGNEQRPTDHNNILRNVVMNTGQVFPGGVGIWIGKSAHNMVANNVIAHTTYTGISVGWTWGYEDQLADDNQIRDNVLFDIGRGMMSDLGGIYTLGKSKGTVISGNLIRQVQDFPKYGAGAWGIYNDEGSSGLTIEGNVVVGTRSGGYHLHYGADNIVRDNVFAGGGGKAEMLWTTPGQSGEWVAKGNATTTPKNAEDVDLNGAPQENKARMGLKPGQEEHTKVDVNADTENAGNVKIKGGNSDQRAIWASALSKARDTLKVATTEMGVDPNALRVPDVAAPAAAVAAAATSSLSWQWQFAQLPAGAPPSGINFAPKRDPHLVTIAPDPTNPSGGNCLLLKDGDPGLQRYEPYVFVQPGMAMADGVSSHFEVKLDDASMLIHEWRDGSTAPYKTILKFGMSPQKGLTVGDKSLTPLPSGAWLDVRVKAQGGTWSLDVSDGKSLSRHWDRLAFVTPSVPQLGWVGWISDTDQVSRTCIRSIDIRPR